MKIPKNILNNAWKIILLPASVAIINSLAGHLEYSFEFQKAQETEPSTNHQKELLTQNYTQEQGNDNINSPQMIGDNIKFSTSSDETNNIEEQNNNEVEEQTINEINQPEQYNNNNGSDINNCVRNNGTCGSNGTTNINLEN